MRFEIIRITCCHPEKDEGIVYTQRNLGFICHIDEKVWHLDVGSGYPPAEVGGKGWAVRPLKPYASWVQNGVSQFGLYPV